MASSMNSVFHPGGGRRYDPSLAPGCARRRRPAAGADLGLHQHPDHALPQASEPIGVSLEVFTGRVLGSILGVAVVSFPFASEVTEG